MTRKLTKQEHTGLRTSVDQLRNTSGTGWLSDEHRKARRSLACLVAAYADAGVSLSDLGDAMGVSKQRAGVLAKVGRLP